MIIFRYLCKEIFTSLATLTAIILLIFMSNQVASYLNRAASGSIPGMVILKLMLLELPSLLGLLLPLGFYVALLLALGRLYNDSEMIVLNSCGYKNSHLLKHCFYIAALVAFIVLLIVFWSGPYIAKERSRLLKNSGIQTLIKTILPGQFHSFGGNVFFVEKMSRDHKKAQKIFLARNKVDNKGSVNWNILWASRAQVFKNKITIHDGYEYQGVIGSTELAKVNFKAAMIKIPQPKNTLKQDIRSKPTKELLTLDSYSKIAELQWRISIPIMVLTLTMLGVPLSKINPRSGKFSRLLPAIILYIIYANLMFIFRDQIVHGKLLFSMALLHLSFFSLGVILFRRMR